MNTEKLNYCSAKAKKHAASLLSTITFSVFVCLLTSCQDNNDLEFMDTTRSADSPTVHELREHLKSEMFVFDSWNDYYEQIDSLNSLSIEELRTYKNQLSFEIPAILVINHPQRFITSI